MKSSDVSETRQEMAYMQGVEDYKTGEIYCPYDCSILTRQWTLGHVDTCLKGLAKIFPQFTPRGFSMLVINKTIERQDDGNENRKDN